MVDGTDKTNRENLNQVAKSKKVISETLYKLPEIEPKIKYLLEWFYQIKKTTEPITYSEIKSWSELTGNLIKPEEVKVLMRLDLEYNLQKQKDK